MNLNIFLNYCLTFFATGTVARLEFKSFEDENLNKEMALMARTVIVDAFGNQTVLLLKFFNEENGPVVEELVNNVVRNVNINHSTPIEFKIYDIDHLKEFWWNSPYNVFIIDSSESFDVFLEKFTITMFDYTGHYLLLWMSTNKTEEEFVRVFGIFWTKYVVNIIIITPDDSGVAVYTYFPFQENKDCEKINLRKLTEPVKGDKNGANLPHFPPKLLNFYGCPLKVATYNLPPVVMVKDNDDGTKYLDGIEGKVMTSLARRLNFRTQLVTPNCPGVRRGILYENGTATPGTQKILLGGLVNMTVGFMFISPRRLEYFGATNQYLTTTLIFFVPQQPLLSTFVRLLLPFHLNVWYLIIFVMAFYITIRIALFFRPKHEQVFVYGPGYRHHLTDLISSFLGGAVSKFPLRNFARTLMVIFIAYAFVIRSAYTGIYFKFLSSKIEIDPVDTILELHKQNYSLFMIADSVEYMENNADLFKQCIIINDFEEGLKKMKQPGFKGALLTSQIHYLYRNIQLPTGEPKFKRTKDSLMAINLAIFMKRESCLLKPFNYHLQWLVEAGLVGKWVTQYVGSEQIEKPQKRFAPLGLIQVGGVIWMYAAALGCCGLVFLGELFYFYGKLLVN